LNISNQVQTKCAFILKASGVYAILAVDFNPCYSSVNHEFSAEKTIPQFYAIALLGMKVLLAKQTRLILMIEFHHFKIISNCSKEKS
jgi:hypothetical protein